MNVADRRIIVVGAGPTGLATALALGLRGLRVTVLEREPGLSIDLRAGSFHPPTIEMLDGLGIGGAMHAEGIVVPKWQMRDRVAGLVAEFDLALLKDETPYPYRLHLEQHRLTPLLLERIESAAPSVTVRFSCPVHGVTQDGDAVDVTLSSGEVIRGDFVIAADGARSTVRRALGVEFEGFTWPERVLVASTTFDLGEHGFAGAGYIADPDLWAAVFHVPDTGPPGLWRIGYPIATQQSEEDALDPEAVQHRLRFIFEASTVQPASGSFPLKYASVYRVHQRVAKSFVHGRIILAGDAAHINNPLGGLGLNGGIHDAINIARKLAHICMDGAACEPLLGLYDRQRRMVNIKAVQGMSIRNKRLLEEKDPRVRAARLAELVRIAGDPVAARRHLMETSMINSVREAEAIA